MFLAHPPDHSLVEHCIEVANKTKEILDDTKFDISKEGFYAGLLHDIGKLNPFYQELFSNMHDEKEKIKQLQEQYPREHAKFSSWAANFLLESVLNYDQIDVISCVIAAHHSKLARTISKPESDKTLATQKIITKYLDDFKREVSNYNDFANLDWNRCMRNYERPIYFNADLAKTTRKPSEDFVRIGFLFSALLQADRGSFREWQKPHFDIRFDTKLLIKIGSNLSTLRTEFGNEALENFDFNESIIVLNAPTGIGKTKVFLDLINTYQEKLSFERVYYFSPLLALTDDFEKKLVGIIPKESQKNILTYNHLFSGSMEEKKRYESSESEQYRWVFEYESFNEKLIITTTQRLLMTMYSNSHSDKIKLASLKNSLLIIDEVQTIPKFLLTNMIEYFKILTQKTGCKIILVSATIPHEMNDISKIKISKNLIDTYLQRTQKNIVFSRLEIGDTKNQKILVMANTRKKASKIFKEIQTKHSAKLYYLSAGIRKKDRLEILSKLNDESECLCVSTQVVEAGVDISFSQIFREAAPLDSIVQVMGRLNRNSEYQNSLLTVFQYDKNWLPYSEIEYNESFEILQSITSSIDLYEILPKYYKKISESSAKNAELANSLNFAVKRMDYEKVSEFVYSNVFADPYQETVFVPKTQEQWHEIKNGVKNLGRLSRDLARKYSYYTASLSSSPKKLDILEKFDEFLLEKNILMPKLEYLNEIYDPSLGLDKWLS